MDYFNGEIFNKKCLVFKDGRPDKNPYGHPVVVINDTRKDGTIYFLKMISDVTRMVEYPGRYKLIGNTRANGLERPSLICVDEIYITDDERELVRGEITLKQYQELIQQMFEYNTEIGNNDECYVSFREIVGDTNIYLNKIAYSWG